MDMQKLNENTKEGAQKLDECSEAIKKSLEAAEDILRECGLKIEGVNLSAIKKDSSNSIKPLMRLCLRNGKWELCLEW